MFLSFFNNNSSQKIARVIIVQEIKTVQYQRIADQIIHQIHRQINVVKEKDVKILSFFTMAYGRAISKSIYKIIQINPISV